MKLRQDNYSSPLRTFDPDNYPWKISSKLTTLKQLSLISSTLENNSLHLIFSYHEILP